MPRFTDFLESVKLSSLGLPAVTLTVVMSVEDRGAACAPDAAMSAAPARQTATRTGNLIMRYLLPSGSVRTVSASSLSPCEAEGCARHAARIFRSSVVLLPWTTTSRQAHDQGGSDEDPDIHRGGRCRSGSGTRGGNSGRTGKGGRGVASVGQRAVRADGKQARGQGWPRRRPTRRRCAGPGGSGTQGAAAGTSRRSTTASVTARGGGPTEAGPPPDQAWMRPAGFELAASASAGQRSIP